MTDDRAKRTEESIREIYEEVEDRFYSLFSSENQEKFSSMLGSVARKSKESFEFALELIGELSTGLTGVKSFKVIPKPPAELEVDIRFKKENQIKFKQAIAPMVEINSVKFGKRIAFGALIERERKALRVNITEGFALEINLGPFMGKHMVDIKGSGLLTRDTKGQIVLITEIDVPGLDLPVEVSIPLRTIFHNLGKVI